MNYTVQWCLSQKDSTPVHVMFYGSLSEMSHKLNYKPHRTFFELRNSLYTGKILEKCMYYTDVWSGVLGAKMLCLTNFQTGRFSNTFLKCVCKCSKIFELRPHLAPSTYYLSPKLQHPTSKMFLIVIFDNFGTQSLYWRYYCD